VISTLGLESIKNDPVFSLLGDEIICASYGLPGTKKLRLGVAAALKKSNGNAVIMKHHGAVCFGRDDEEAFKAALDLEVVCNSFIADEYKKISGAKDYDPDEMRLFALIRIAHKWKTPGYESSGLYYNSERTQNGFKLYVKNGKTIDISFGQLSGNLPREAEIHNEIYLKNKNINYIIHEDNPDILTASRANITLYPLVDDFAQIVGTKVKTVLKDPAEAAEALKNASAVLSGSDGAFCCGASQQDASAVHMIMEKNCKALIAGTLFGKTKPISWLDRNLMRFVYLKKYSKQISDNRS
jgi:L-fuculose-phosphate aldolase